MNMEDKEFIKKYILNNPFDFKQGIISHCREMDKIDVYNWVAEDELKIDKLKQENKHLDEVNCILRKTNERLRTQIRVRESVCDRLVGNWNLLKRYCYEIENKDNRKLNGLDVLNKIQELEKGSDIDE